MKYFGWSEKEVMNMTYEKFTMYLSDIPELDIEDNDKASSDNEEPTGGFNLFDFDQRKPNTK